MLALRIRLGLIPKHDNVDLALRFADALLAGAPYTQQTLAQCYHSHRSRAENPEVSSAWLTFLWGRIVGLSIDDWREATKSRESFVSFVHGFWGKDV
jgi:hypothetical protein